MPDKLNSSLSEKELQFKIISLVGIWAEALLYGLYFSLFVAALPVFVRGDVLRTFPAKVFLAGNTLMFLLISTHTAPVFLAMTIWIGDALVVRLSFKGLFLIWRRSYWVVTVPALLFVSSVAIHSTNLCHGVIIESAALHTAALLVMLVLRILGNPSHFYLGPLHLVPPTIGIVFVLMTIRTHALREEARIVPESASLMPNWLMEREGRLELGMERGRRADLSTPTSSNLQYPGNNNNHAYPIFSILHFTRPANILLLQLRRFAQGSILQLCASGLSGHGSKLPSRVYQPHSMLGWANLDHAGDNDILKV
ncbi:hypothetical protein BKA70DRAFT_1243697 [Coprinopsis sp. MPI-PUGE-AT-0042]|nr:hypothetical protein BKA70DRAFT_1243697 [Coprinopsis sp. MPI-PUGE-AT-0042]